MLFRLMVGVTRTRAAWLLAALWIQFAGCYAATSTRDAASADAASAVGQDCLDESDCSPPLSCAHWLGGVSRSCAVRCDRRTGGDLCEDGSLCAGYFDGIVGSQGWCFPGGVSQIGESCELVTCEFGAACAHPVRGAPGVCVPACDLEADCGPREACREGACTPVCEPTDPRACPEGSLCDQGVCTEAQLLTTCFDGAACALGTICRSTSTWHECVAADDPRFVRRCGDERILVDGVCYPRGA